jgi:hypothetical protein
MSWLIVVAWKTLGIYFLASWLKCRLTI